jgi:hypothetical protein
VTLTFNPQSSKPGMTPEQARQILDNAKFADKQVSAEVKQLSAELCECFELDRVMLYRYMYAVAAHERADEVTVGHVREAAKWLIDHMEEGVF